MSHALDDASITVTDSYKDGTELLTYLLRDSATTATKANCGSIADLTISRKKMQQEMFLDLQLHSALG